MKFRKYWLILLAVALMLGKSTEALASHVFESPWLLTEDEPTEWSRDQALVYPGQLTGWKPYTATTVPAGINKTIWLQNQLPVIQDQRQVLYFANGLEDIAVYIDNVLVHSSGLLPRAGAMSVLSAGTPFPWDPSIANSFCRFEPTMR
ncbi:MAG: hypothetical protein M3Q07_22305 [Pseudobdellovibrionaceae bacterium]|nr:hypothetical protein [Pseudobdellovibrionaceae bacterium]